MFATALPRWRRLLRTCRRFLWNSLAVIGLILIVYHVGFDLTRVSSGSMSPTLKGEGGPGSDWLLTEKLTYHLRSPRRWELVQFETTDAQVVSKRVVGLPGETVAVVGRERTLLLNGHELERPAAMPHIKYLPYGRLFRGQPAACGEGYFVLGDDTDDSLDSRYEGPVKPQRITGRPWLRVWPVSRIGFVNP